MPVDRDTWSDTFCESHPLKWQCPSCGHTVAPASEIDGPETGQSLSWRDSDAWEPEWIQGRFFARYECVHCKDPAIMVGTYTLREEPWTMGATQQEFTAHYKIGAIEPPPKLIRLPANLPEEIAQELGRAFALFWINGQACANAIRGVVEVFLNVMRVRKTSGSGRHQDRLTLHRRIEEFGKKNPQLSGALMAAKWIGNVGSHAEPVGRDTLFDGFDLLEFVLEESFDDRREKVARLAKEISRRRGRHNSRQTK